jgi:hypothetical protein
MIRIRKNLKSIEFAGRPLATMVVSCGVTVSFLSLQRIFCTWMTQPLMILDGYPGFVELSLLIHL